MFIEAKELSKIYGSGGAVSLRWIKSTLKLHPAILFLLWDHLAAAKVPCSTCCLDWTSRLPAV